MKPLTAWSYSRFSLYETCPLRFKHEVLEGNKSETSPAMARGDTIHKAIAAWIMNQAEGLPRDVFKFPRIEALLLEMRAQAEKVVEQQWGFTAFWKPTGWFDKDTWLRVVLDAGFIYTDLTAEAVDFKTGKRYGHNDDQMELFALAMMCKYQPVKHVTTRLVYIDTGDEEFAEYPATHKQRLIDKWTAKVEPMFTDKVFAPRPNEKCKFCPLARSKGGKCAFG